MIYNSEEYYLKQMIKEVRVCIKKTNDIIKIIDKMLLSNLNDNEKINCEYKKEYYANLLDDYNLKLDEYESQLNNIL